MGFFVSPAVIAIDSVPPSEVELEKEKNSVAGRLHAKEAVTKTDANPPIPLTNGASPMYQLCAPRYL